MYLAICAEGKIKVNIKCISRYDEMQSKVIIRYAKK